MLCCMGVTALESHAGSTRMGRGVSPLGKLPAGWWGTPLHPPTRQGMTVSLSAWLLQWLAHGTHGMGADRSHRWLGSAATHQQAQEPPSNSRGFAMLHGEPRLPAMLSAPACPVPPCGQPLLAPAAGGRATPSSGTHGAGWLHPGLPVHLHGQQLGCPEGHKERERR